MTMIEIIAVIQKPWPWYVAGPLIGSIVPLLLILGNKSFGVSSSLRHVCAACFPARIPFFQYDWKKEAWNLFFALGLVLGGCITAFFLSDLQPIHIHPELRSELAEYGLTSISALVPEELFNVEKLFSFRGFVLMIVGGFLVGFGTRYAGGCTSGHAIFGISALRLPSFIATCCFMLGGWLSANFLIPFILQM